MTWSRGNDGFTLVELMTVVLIVGILVSICIPIFNVAKDRAELMTCFASQRTIEGALQAYSAAHGGTYPNGGVAGVLLGTDPLVTDGYMQSQPICPGSRDAYWITADQTVDGDMSAAGAWYASSTDHKNFAAP
jgi:prepilin-type N-terminal cleavage/methylation domain-containing protein